MRKVKLETTLVFSKAVQAVLDRVHQDTGFPVYVHSLIPADRSESYDGDIHRMIVGDGAALDYGEVTYDPETNIHTAYRYVYSS